jgi:hypothetical protein
MKHLSILASAVFAFGFTSGTDKPEACFDQDQQTAAMNSPVTVSANCSVYSKSFYWAAKDENGETLDENVVTLAGDGCESEETFTFSTPGTCKLHLSVSRNLFSDEVERIVAITDEEVPVDDTTPDTDGGDDHIPTR